MRVIDRSLIKLSDRYTELLGEEGRRVVMTIDDATVGMVQHNEVPPKPHIAPTGFHHRAEQSHR